MFTTFNEKKLKNLMDDFCGSFAKINNLYDIPKYGHVLQHISCFVVLPDWKETYFLSRGHAKEIIPSYVDQRRDLFSDDDCSSVMINEGLISNYFKALKTTCPKAVHFCNQLIKVLLLANLDSYIEGTSASGLGIAHIDFKKHYNENDFNELIIHQITHMLLFIDDHIDPHVVDSNKMLPIETTVKHKRGGNSFPLYTLFHSLCVGVEVLHYRLTSDTLMATVNYHAQTVTAIKRCSDCLVVLIENIALFTSKGSNVLREYEAILDDLRIRILKCYII